ncbi:hypothetical protein EYZ11_004122 [Aspergillus tanneri]|uniref:Uncharacterized protein n=1 Tax=Aspergillus tanneri TaxID=1220188 RepID=A0A4S3JNN1_9EURO|nr:hypothetical protein EYZ11_004122 [Aspergillus tanneri]
MSLIVLVKALAE